MSSTQISIQQLAYASPWAHLLNPGPCRVVDPSGLLATDAHSTITDALEAAADDAEFGNIGANVLVAPGDYDEAVVWPVGGNRISVVGIGPKGSVNVAPSASNANGLIVEGTAATRTKHGAIANVNFETNGTGTAMRVKGNIRNFRAYASKCEGGTNALHVLTIVGEAPADCHFNDMELAWATNGVVIELGVAGEMATQIMLRKSHLHNIVTDCYKTLTGAAKNLWILENIFDAQEDGTEPTQFLDIDEADTTGLVAGNRFATTVFSTAKFAIADGVLFGGDNRTQAETPPTTGGTAGRPD